MYGEVLVVQRQVAEPGHQHANEEKAQSEGQDDDDARPDAVDAAALHQAVALDQGVIAEALQKSDGHSGWLIWSKHPFMSPSKIHSGEYPFRRML